MLKHYNPSEIENMIINILEEGKEENWKNIENYFNPLTRCHYRKIFTEAIKKLEDEK